jgi:hypothetical protein
MRRNPYEPIQLADRDGEAITQQRDVPPGVMQVWRPITQ